MAITMRWKLDGDESEEAIYEIDLEASLAAFQAQFAEQFRSADATITVAIQIGPVLKGTLHRSEAERAAWQPWRSEWDLTQSLKSLWSAKTWVVPRESQDWGRGVADLTPQELEIIQAVKDRAYGWIRDARIDEMEYMFVYRDIQTGRWREVGGQIDRPRYSRLLEPAFNSYGVVEIIQEMGAQGWCFIDERAGKLRFMRSI